MNKLVNNASWLIGCKLVQSILSFIIALLTARYLGPSNYGVLNYASSLVVFVTPVMTLGFNGILVQEFIANKEDEGEVLGTTLISCICSAVICMIAVVIFAFFTNSNDKCTVVVCTLFSLNLLFQALQLVEYWFQAQLLSKYTSIVSLIAYAIVSIYKIYLLATGKSVYWFAISYAFDYMIISIVLLFIYKKLGGMKVCFSLDRAKRMFNRSKYYIASGLMVTIFTQTDKIMLNMMIGNDATGYYSAALICATMANFVFTAIIDSFRPVILENKIRDENRYKLSIRRLYNIVVYLSLIQCVVIVFLSGIIINITYGEEFIDAVPVLRILVWQTAFSYLGIVRDIWLLAEGKQKYLWSINLCGAVLNVILNLVFIPIIGIEGAAFASLLTQALVNVGIGFIFKPIKGNNKLLIQGLNINITIDLCKKLLKIKR